MADRGFEQQKWIMYQDCRKTSLSHPLFCFFLVRMTTGTTDSLADIHPALHLACLDINWWVNRYISLKICFLWSFLPKDIYFCFFLWHLKAENVCFHKCKEGTLRFWQQLQPVSGANTGHVLARLVMTAAITTGLRQLKHTHTHARTSVWCHKQHAVDSVFQIYQSKTTCCIRL